MGLARIELATSALSVLRSNRLSYSPANRCTTLHQGPADPKAADLLVRPRLRAILGLAGHGGHGGHGVPVVEVHDPDPGGVAALGGDLPHGGADDDAAEVEIEQDLVVERRP